MQRTALILIVLAGVPGCLKAQLRTPAEDHAVQAQLIAESCARKGYGYGYGKCTQEDIEAMADQAKCIDAIVKGETCGKESE